ncbi:MAG: sulfotransferase [Pseudomonadota bacterium]
MTSRHQQDLIERLLALIVGTPSMAKRLLPPALRAGAAVHETIDARRADWGCPAPPDDPALTPIWVLAAGWGSGSTLVQRLLMSTGKAVIWGEPLDQAVPIPHLAAPLSVIRPDWPPAEHFRPDLDPKALAQEWVANLLPPLPYLREGQRAFVESWLRSSVASVPAAGVQAYGLKEVRLCAGYGAFLKWLFPASRLVFVVRHPYDCWRSCKGVDWYSVWPDHRVGRRLAFAHHWAYLTRSFLDHAASLDALVLPYESLTPEGTGLEKLSHYVGLGALDGDVLERRIGSRGTGASAGRRRQLGAVERKLIAAVCAREMARLGYAL